MSHVGPGSGVPKQVLDLEPYRCRVQSQPCCLPSTHEAPGEVPPLPGFLISQVGMVNPDRPQLY